MSIMEGGRTTSALLYLDGQTLPQDVKRAAELLRVAADAGNPEAQYALATFYKEGTGVPKDIDKAVRLLQAASLAGNVDAEVEYAIALFNGTGTPKNVPFSGKAWNPPRPGEFCRNAPRKFRSRFSRKSIRHW